MRNKMTVAEFNEAVKGRRFKAKSISAARKVLIEGKTYQEAGTIFGMSKQQVWEIVNLISA